MASAAAAKNNNSKKEKNKNLQKQTTSTGVNGTKKDIGDNKKNKKADKKREILKKIAKIDNLPKNVRESIPFRGILPNGVIETYPGTFTKTYKLEDVNFTEATDSEQMSMFNGFMDLLNAFNEKTKWQITIYNHSVNKKETIDNIRIAPQRDGLNKYRQELNSVLLDNLKKGNNLIKQDKCMTIAIDDNSVEHADAILKRTDVTISKKINAITNTDTKPLTSQERMKLLYDIYNQDTDYRMATGILDGKEVFSLEHIEKLGLSVKDVIGPSSFDFSNFSMFKVGDTYAQGLFVASVPSYLSTDFLAELSEVKCNMLISMTSDTIAQDKARKMVMNKISSIEGQIARIQERNNNNGLFTASLPPDLENAKISAHSLYDDLTKRNQNMFFMMFSIVIFAKTKEQLNENVALIKEVGDKFICPIQPAAFQQEFLFNTALPLCRDDMPEKMKLLHTTETASVFIPYNSQEISQRHAIFYGLNQTTKSMIMYDRTSGKNYNALIFGQSGSGKSFMAKVEMISVILKHPEAQVFVIDPQGEYKLITRALKGEVIRIAPGSGVYINPLDMNLTEAESNDDEKYDPVTLKSSFILSMFDIMIGGNGRLNPTHSSLIDKCIRKIYQPYIAEMQRQGKQCDLSMCPTLSDLYQELMLMRNERYEAQQLTDILSQYAIGSFDTFAHRTNVHTNARFIDYDISSLGSGRLRELGLHVCVNDVWNRMIENSKKNIYTWVYIDEFHILLDSEMTTSFLKKIWKMARKWLGVPTGIMQNTEDLLRDGDTRAIVNTTQTVLMFDSPLMDRQNMAELFGLSNTQLEHITNSPKGSGLLRTGSSVIPFELDFPHDSEIYKLITTAHDA